MLTLGPAIARGATATVYECANDPATVIKHVRCADAPTTVCEIALLCAMSHPNVMRICGIGAMDSRGSISVQMPRYDCTLADVPVFTRAHAVSLLRGLAYIHARGVIHCDLKPANIFVQGDSCIIADFGLARLSHSARALHQVQSPAYRAPEVAVGVALTRAIDMWSIGVIIAELAYKYMLDINTDDGTVYARAYYGIPGDSGRASNIRTIVATSQTVRAAVFAHAHTGATTCDPVLEQLTRACLRFDPSTRITATGALELLGDTAASTAQPSPLLPARDDAAIVHILARADVTNAAISPDTLAAGVAAVSKCISGRIPDVNMRELMGAFRVIRATRGQMLL